MARKASRQAGRSKPVPKRTHEEEMVANFFLGLLLVFLVVLVYYPVFNAGFVWDDDQLLTANQQVQSAMGWWTLWVHPTTADYFPLTSTTLWLEWHIWGMNAAGYHVTNVLMHAVTVLLTWQVLKRLAVPGAWVAAAFFAVHPVCVESVAWISERKNTISQIFFLLSIINYLRYQEKARLWRYIAAVVCFTLSLLAKTSVVMLPFILLVLSWWRYRDLEPMRETYDLEKNPVERGILPWSLAIAGGIMGLGGLFMITGNSSPTGVAEAFLAAAACAAAGWFAGIFLRNLDALPATLSALGVIGGILAVAVLNFFSPMNRELVLVLSAAAAMIGGGTGFVAGYYIRQTNLWNRFAGFEIIRSVPFFLVAVILGIVTIYFQYKVAIGGEEIPLGNMAQRMASACFATGFYLYSAFWPFKIIEIYPQWHRAFSILITQPKPHWDGPDPEALPYYLQVIPGIIIAGFMGWCWTRRTEAWARALLAAVGCYILGMLPALGLLKMSYMRLTLVADHFQYISIIAVIALVVAGGFQRAFNPVWLWIAAAAFAFISFQNWNSTQDNHFEQLAWIGGTAALAMMCGNDEMWSSVWRGFIGVSLLSFSVMSYYQAGTYHNEESLWSATLSKNPNTWQGHNHLGAALYLRQDYKDAYPHFARAVELKPENPESHNNLALILTMFGQPEEAIKQYEIAVGIKDDTSMETNLANAYASVRRYDDAVRTYKHAIELQSSNASAHCNLGYVLLQLGRVDEAIPEFIKTIELDPDGHMPQGPTDLKQALIAKGIDTSGTAVSGTYSFDANYALKLLHDADARIQQQQQDQPPQPQGPGQ